jgi:hypothetical protein
VGPLSVSTAAIDMMRVGAEREPESARNGRNKVKKALFIFGGGTTYCLFIMDVYKLGFNIG